MKQVYAIMWHLGDMGMGGVLCIHPKQVAVVKAMLRPSETELAFARAVVAEYQRSQAAVFQVQGKMVDMPVILRAQKLLAHGMCDGETLRIGRAVAWLGSWKFENVGVWLGGRAVQLA